MIARFVVWLLKRKKLSVKDKTLITNALLEAIKTVPLQALITQTENGAILVQGKALSGDEAFLLRESASNALNSRARNLIQSQVRFAAIDAGFLKNNDPEIALFYKAAIFYSQQENELLKFIAGNTVPEDVDN